MDDSSYGEGYFGKHDYGFEQEIAYDSIFFRIVMMVIQFR